MMLTGNKPQDALPDLAAIRTAQLEPWLPFIHGDRFASLLVLKGEPGPSELAGNPPFFGEDGSALNSAFVAMGLKSTHWCGIVCGHPTKGRLSARDVRELIEIIDPLALVALDRKAIEILQQSFAAEVLPAIPKPGTKTSLMGRTLVFVDGFEAALASDDGQAKHRVWKELKALQLQ